MRCSLLSSSCFRNVSFCCIPILLFYVAKSWLSHIMHHEPSACNSTGAYTYAAKFFQRSSSQKFLQVMKFQSSVPPEIHVWPLAITPLQSENFLQMCIHEKDQPLWPQYIKQHLILWLLNVMRTVQQEPDFGKHHRRHHQFIVPCSFIALYQIRFLLAEISTFGWWKYLCQWKVDIALIYTKPLHFKPVMYVLQQHRVAIQDPSNIQTNHHGRIPKPAPSYPWFILQRTSKEIDLFYCWCWERKWSICLRTLSEKSGVQPLLIATHLGSSPTTTSQF